jgi:elongation factor P--(R)-beta-lysine ligase
MLAELNKKNSSLIQIRDFFQQRNITEVVSPCLHRYTIPDLNIEQFVVETQKEKLYLQSSPELFLKKMLIAGAGDIYSITSSFRKNEISDIHKQEFTMIEWYRKNIGYMNLCDETTDLILHLDQKKHNLQVIKMSYDSLLQKYLKRSYKNADIPFLRYFCQDKKISLPDGLSRDEILDLIISTHISCSFSSNLLHVIYDYPPSQAHCAKITNKKAARFEIYWGQTELANGCEELNDTNEQLQRFIDTNKQREKRALKPFVYDDDFVLNIKNIGKVSGVAVGFDRLFMKIYDAKKIL